MVNEDKLKIEQKRLIVIFEASFLFFSLPRNFQTWRIFPPYCGPCTFFITSMVSSERFWGFPIWPIRAVYVVRLCVQSVACWRYHLWLKHNIDILYCDLIIWCYWYGWR